MTAYAFTKEEVLAIHSAAITMFGGVDGVRDEGLLDSAMSQPFRPLTDTISIQPKFARPVDTHSE